MSIQLPLPLPPDEQWKDIPGYEGVYQVSNQGRIKALRPGRHNRADRILASPLSGGYPYVQLYKDGIGKMYHNHRLVMLAFVGPCPEGMNVNHKNGVKTDGRLENLEYVTFKENLGHARRELGFNNSGMNHRLARLSDGEVHEMRELYASGRIKQIELAQKYGIAQSTISYILNRKAWKHIE